MGSGVVPKKINMKKHDPIQFILSLLFLLFVAGNANAQFHYNANCFSSFTGTNGFSVGDYPKDIAAADFNGDGKKDLVTVNYSSHNISVLMGTGTGSFLPAVNYSMTSSAYCVVTGDFNNDGDVDIAATGNNNVMFMYLNTGTGAFGPFTAFNNFGYSVGDLLTQDVNNDGNLDIVRTNGTVFNVFLGTGTGSLVPLADVTTSISTVGLASGDFNEDGFNDIVVAGNSPREVRIFIGNNTGSYTLSSVTSVGSTFNYPVSITSGDLNSDGHIDAIVGTAAGSGFVLHGTGTGTFSTLDLTGNPQEPLGIDVADFDLDGRSDYVAVGDYNPGIQMHIQNGFYLNTMTNLYVGNNTEPDGLVAADFNNDGRPDIATANRGTDNVHVYISKIPSVLVSPNYTICAGQSVTVSISTAGSYSWNSGSNISNSIVVTPSLNTQITFTGTTSDGCYALVEKRITVITGPTITVNSGSICSGNNFTINPTGAINYSITGGSFVVNPTGTTNFTVSGTDSFSCGSVGSAVATVTVHALPVLSVNSGSMCTGNSFTIVPTGANNYTVTGGATVVSPTSNTDYTVTGKSSVGCPASNTVVSSLTVSPEPAPVISVNSGSVCKGQSFTISPSGADTYTFSGGSNIVSPAATTNYFVSGTSTAGCVSAAAAISGVTVMQLPTITVNSGTICLGNTFAIFPNGAATYVYEGGSQTVSPTSTQSYSVAGTNSAGCTSLPVLSTVTVVALPVISVNNATLCAGKTITLVPSGAHTYTISGNSFSVSPTTNTSYAVTGASSVGCLSSNTAVAQVTVHALPVVSVNSGSICSGKNFTILPTGALNYSVTGNNFTVSPGTTTNYAVTGSSSVGCLSSNTAIANVTVFATPLVAVNSGSICAGQQFSIIPTGAASFVVAGSNTVVSPNTTASYTVTGTSTAGCLSSNTATSTVTVHQLPVVSVNSGSICVGQSITLTPTGANSYNIQGGNNVVSPSANATYTVTGTSSVGCASSNTATASVTVHALPLITVNSGTVCSGSVFTLTPSGAANYIYSNGSNTTAPTSNSTYFVWGTSSVGCASSNTAISNVTIVALPVVTISGPASNCKGQSSTLTASGASTYLWGNSANTATIVVNPVSTSTYIVTGTDINLCSNSTTHTLVVNIQPSVSATASQTTVCYGSSVTLNGAGASTYQWSGGVSNNVPFTATATNIYTVTGIDLNSCQSTAMIMINVNNLPVVSTIPGNTLICMGKSISLAGTGANTYVWSGGITNASAFFPTSGASYTVTGTDANGCSASAQVSVGLNALPTISTTTSMDTICAGESVVLTADGANIYVWNTGDQTKTITQILSANTAFTVTGTDVNGCINLSVITQIVEVCAGIKDNALHNDVAIYPNPNNGAFKLNLGVIQSAQLIIYDDAGRIVEQRNISGPDAEIQTPHLANGIYLVRITSNGQNILNRKMIKQ
jgi:hypothetical protein